MTYVPLDVLELGRILELRMVPIQVSHPLMQCRITTPNIPNVALEVLHVHRIEPDNCNKEPDVHLRQHVPEPIWPFSSRKVLLGAVQGLEEGSDVALVGLGLGSEPGFVDAVVDEIVDPRVGIFDLGTEVRRVEVDLPVLLVNEIIELSYPSVLAKPWRRPTQRNILQNPASSESRCSHC